MVEIICEGHVGPRGHMAGGFQRGFRRDAPGWRMEEAWLHFWTHHVVHSVAQPRQKSESWRNSPQRWVVPCP